MKMRYWLGIAAVIYFFSGFFVIPANQKGVVRRFGRVQPGLRSSGLNYDLPWPFTQIDRVNFNEVRTLTLGELESDPNFLLATTSTRPSSFLTGDKNLLQLTINVHYRVSEEHVVNWLYGSDSVVRRLQLIVESATTDLVSRCGVDFVHTQGLAELNNHLLCEVRRHVNELQLGCDIEQVSIDRAEPPARAKAEFLDVSNARADMSRTIHEARGYAEQKQAESQADARKIIDDAEQIRQQRTSAARGSADRFETLVAQIHRDVDGSSRSYADARRLVMERMTTETLRQVLGRAKQKYVLNGEAPFDLTLPAAKGTP